MGTRVGKDGSVEFESGVIAEIRQFKLMEAQASIDANSMSSPNWDKSEGGRKSWSAEMEIFYDPDDAGQAAVATGAIGSFVFYPEGNTSGLDQRTGTGRVESIDLDQSHDGMIEMSIKVVGTGELADWTAVP